VEFNLYRLAVETGVNRRRLSTEFFRHCGVSLRKWIREQRAVRARAWLKRMFPVKEVAAIVGYRHVSRFIVEFRSVYGISPGEFQRSFRDANEWAWTDKYRRSRRAIRLSKARAKRKGYPATTE
jgi:AraC family chemosensory pili system transcriptional regulator ChpD